MSAQPAEMTRAICGAKHTQDGAPCQHEPGWGTEHPGIGRCKYHGGSTPTHVAAARKALAQQSVATLGLPRDVDPQQALLEEVHRTAGHVAWLSDLVGDLDPLDLSDGEGFSVWVRLYQAERKHLVEVTKAAIACGLAAREVELAEREGALLAQVILRILSDLELSDAQREMAPGVVRRHLTAVKAAS